MCNRHWGCLLVCDLLSKCKELQTYWQRKMRPKVGFMLLVSFQFRRVSGGTESEDFALLGHGCKSQPIHGGHTSFPYSFLKKFLLDYVNFQHYVSFRCTENWISYTHTYIYTPPFFFRFFVFTIHYRILSRAPCAI